MGQDDTNENDAGKIYIKIPLPATNEDGLKGMKRWAKKAYRKARLQVNQRKAQKIKAMMPFEMAAYAERKVFGNWRLVAPYRDTVGAIHESPLQTAIRALRPYIVPRSPPKGAATRWDEFRRQFVNLLKLAFNAICDSDYDQKIVDQVNGWLDELLKRFAVDPAHPVEVHYVLRPETAQGYSSPEFLKTRSAIWERFTGKGLNLDQFTNPTAAGRQMEMELECVIK
ncbi:MAG: hypothetical protein HY811_06025 [Planctomycetes bacterium]|nr:hypothetical protein [Planctomycetota bacterium]